MIQVCKPKGTNPECAEGISQIFPTESLNPIRP